MDGQKARAMELPALQKSRNIATIRALPRSSVPALLLTTILTLPAWGAFPWESADGSLPSLAPMLEEAVPAVVNISTAHEEVVRMSPLFRDPFFQHFFGQPGRRSHKRVRRGLGTGVILDAEKGHVVTNHHLIAKADQITVTLGDGREIKAEVIGSDSETDVAMLRVQADNLTTLPIADSERVSVGDFVVAIGNPFGLGQTVTSGIISALGRSGVFDNYGYEDFIQTDASINPGNSGGALVNLRGELIGINTAILSRSGGNIGIGFAIPIHMVRQVADQLIEFGQVRRGQLGVQAQAMTPELAEAFGLERSEGVVITEVVPGSPAERAGITPGDVLIRIDGEEIFDVKDMRNVLGLLRAGREVEIELLRGRAVVAVRAATATLRIDGANLHPGMAGLTLSTGRDSDATFVEIIRVEPGHPAARAGIRAGDRLRSVNRRPVKNVEDIRAVISRDSPQVLLQIQRGARRQFLLLP